MTCCLVLFDVLRLCLSYCDTVTLFVISVVILILYLNFPTRCDLATVRLFTLLSRVCGCVLSNLRRSV